MPKFETESETILYRIEGDLQEQIAALDHGQTVDEFGFDLSLYTAPDGLIETGVYRLDCSEWTEESKNELLNPNNQNGFISISPDGTPYVARGGETVQGYVLVYHDPNNLPEGEPLCLLSFDGKIRPASCLQLVLTVEDMDAYTYVGSGNTSTDWTFIWEDGNYWTEESLRDDIG